MSPSRMRRFLEAEDAERVPVVDEHHRLVGVLSRSVLQRRLAEDEEEEDDEDRFPGCVALSSR